MPRVTGLGGVFFKAHDKARLLEWYRDRLGIDVQSWGGTTFEWREKEDPARVDNLDEVLAALKAEGVEVDPRIDESEFGRFGWVMDPEGHRIELWQPPKDR